MGLAVQGSGLGCRQGRASRAGTGTNGPPRPGGIMLQAYVLICNESGTEDSVLSDLSQIPGIRAAYGTFGPYDIVSVAAGNGGQVLQDVSDRVRNISQIRSALTLLVSGSGRFSKTARGQSGAPAGHPARAFVMIRCRKADGPAVIEGLRQIPEVTGADCLAGSYEVMCRITAPTYNDISDIVGKKIRGLGRIRSAMPVNVIDDQGFARQTQAA